MNSKIDSLIADAQTQGNTQASEQTATLQALVDTLASRVSEYETKISRDDLRALIRQVIKEELSNQ
jgi:spore coat protein CotH